MNIIAILYTSFVLLCGCVQKEILFSVPIFRDNEMQKEMSINVGDILNFELDSNPTTGYEWVLEYDRTILNLIKSSFIESEKKGIVGASGKQRFRFKAIRKGTSTIIFSYKRAWEKEKPAKKFVCNIKIR